MKQKDSIIIAKILSNLTTKYDVYSLICYITNRTNHLNEKILLKMWNILWKNGRGLLCEIISKKSYSPWFSW